MTRALVLGARGQVGSHLCAQLGPAAHGISSADLDLTSLDLAEAFDALIAAQKPDIIINMAAYTDVAGAETNEAHAMQVNAHAVRTMVQVASAHDLPFIHGSTDYVLSGMKEDAYREDDAAKPLNAYGRTKLAGEQAVCAYARGYVLRYSWVYDAAGKNFLTTMAALMRKAPQLRVVADQWGAPSYAADLAAATVQFAQSLPAAGIYHMCAGGHTSWHGFACAIEEALKAAGVPVVTHDIDAISSAEYGGPVQRPTNSRLDTAKLAAIGITLPHWRDGLARAVKAMVATTA